ncbi:guanine nucleotide-binding protein G(q) subunit alpha [Acrasis kona]|uniref:Guanine nucleotide-binding protein G(Q) subunit alpha n=1 Tax=Acrasis kona TaxID=1008807 RepID=A0AAW2YR37_9EUKA
MGAQLSNHINPAHSHAFNEKGNKNATKIVFLGAGEGGKATMFKQLMHMYGTKKCRNRHETTSSLIDPRDLEEDYVNSLYCEDTRKSFIPIIHRNTLLAMHSLINGAINTFNYDLDLANNPEIREALDVISVQREHAIGLEDWHLDYTAAKQISFLWSKVPAIQQTYQRRNELELEYMESAKYWFHEINRIIQPNYVPSMRDIFRVRVKTTGIVDSEIYVPIKVKKKRKSGHVGPDDNFVETQLKYKPVKIVLMGSQRNERKKWIHAFSNVSAVIFVVALSEYNQVLYEDGRTNRLRESLLLFDEIVNSSYFTDTPVFLFLNKQDVFLEKISTWDLSGVFPDLPKDLRLNPKENRQATFLPNLIAARVASQTEMLLMQTPTQQVSQQDTLYTFSDDESPNSPNKKERGLKKFLKKRRKNGSSKTNNELTQPNVLGPSPMEPLTMRLDTPIVRRRSSVFRKLVEEQSDAVNSQLASVSSYAITGKVIGEDDIDQVMTVNSYYDERTDDGCSDTDTYPANKEYFGSLMNLPQDALLYVCMFLEARDLCNLNQVNQEWYILSNSEIVWRALLLRYGAVDESEVFKFYEEWIESNPSNQKTTIKLRKLTTPNDTSSCTPQRKPNEVYTSIRKGRYKHYHEMGSRYVSRNIEFIKRQFMEKTTRTDIVTYVTCSVDSSTFKPLMEQTMMRILRGKHGKESNEDENKSDEL